MLSTYLNSQFSLLQYADFFLRIIAACACGFALGIERSHRFKEAGVRTHMIVCCAAALMMIVSKYGFADLTSPEGTLFNGTRGADAARIAAQVISGISFLGAGMIFKNGSNVKGLTTAAGIWATAGIGLAIGCGFYVLGIFCTILIAGIQMLMHIVTVGADSYKSSNIDILTENLPDFQKEFNEQMKTLGATVIECRITREGELMRYNATLKTKKSISADVINDMFSGRKDVKEISVISI